MSTEEEAWAAGFFEGEGSVSLDKRKTGNYIRLSVSQHHHRYTLDRLCKAFGDRGKVYGPYAYPTGSKWSWICVAADDVKWIMEVILENYLSDECVKRIKYYELAEYPQVFEGSKARSSAKT